MISLFLKIKKNKVLFSLVIALFAVALFDVIAIVINVVQMIKTGSNAASLMGAFLPFNIVVIAINVIAVASVVLYVVLKRFTRLEV